MHGRKMFYNQLAIALNLPDLDFVIAGDVMLITLAKSIYISIHTAIQRDEDTVYITNIDISIKSIPNGNLIESLQIVPEQRINVSLNDLIYNEIADVIYQISALKRFYKHMIETQ